MSLIIPPHLTRPWTPRTGSIARRGKQSGLTIEQVHLVERFAEHQSLQNSQEILDLLGKLSEQHESAVEDARAEASLD
jgi:hypothetical protein